ncbi:hypothetical protein BT96DRAFT_525374 [Gymnopus androsaceus JB14]|uniref:Uncharacterized protein n=1 Tax=Gymnopus androsaceus JB14 TaxID=1447944 RepID=A0A6A4IFV0_9AGAR|nr:hypothetical protein BT96DRAFT_525374 [Gymnopus androsaceus JB14]
MTPVLSLSIRLILLCTSFVGFVHGSTFQWPNLLLSYSDRQLYEGPLNFAQGCAARDDTTVAAQWLRLASAFAMAFK